MCTPQLEEFKRRKAAAQAAKKQQQSSDAPSAAPAEPSSTAEPHLEPAPPPTTASHHMDAEPPALPAPDAEAFVAAARVDQAAAAPAHHRDEPAPSPAAPSDASGWDDASPAPPTWAPAGPADEHDWQTLDHEDAPVAHSGSIGSVNGPDDAAGHPEVLHMTAGSDAAASNGGASFTAESPDVARDPAAADPADQSELEQWQTYATGLEEQLAAAQADVGAWADAHQELSSRLEQTEEALAVHFFASAWPPLWLLTWWSSANLGLSALMTSRT